MSLSSNVTFNCSHEKEGTFVFNSTQKKFLLYIAEILEKEQFFSTPRAEIAFLFAARTIV